MTGEHRLTTNDVGKEAGDRVAESVKANSTP